MARSSDSPMHVTASADGLDDLRARFLEALLIPEARLARTLLLDAATAGVSPQRLYLDVLRPALHEVGRLWEQARIGVAQEHLATQIAQSVLAELSLRMTGNPSVGAGRQAIVASSPGEMHVIGGRMVADFLEADGWEVLVLNADVPPAEVARLAEEHAVDVVALSTALASHLPDAATTCALLRRLERPPFVIVGGQGYGGDRERALGVGADEFAEDPESMLRLLAAWVTADDRPVG